MIPQVILKKVILPFIMKELSKYLDYVDKPNELDLVVEELQKFRKEDKIKLNAAIDLFKGSTEAIDKLTDNMKSANKEINKFKNSLEQISKIAHPPAIPLKDINELKESAKDVKWMMGLFKIMKKNPLLKSIFK